MALQLRGRAPKGFSMSCATAGETDIMKGPHTLPSTPSIFGVTPAQRSALARERFFTAGVRPSGLVTEAVIQSWYRCATAGRSTRERLTLDTLSQLRISTALRTSRELRQNAAPGLSRLEAAIAGTPCQVILTNGSGTVVYASQLADSHEEPVLRHFTRVGVDLSEQALGTNAPGLVVRTGQACAVRQGEHFNDAILHVQCVAAPIRDIDARLAGVLNLSIEGRAFGFDALALVCAYAAVFEDQLVAWQARDNAVLALQTDGRLLNSHQAGLMVLDEGGCLKWLNEAAMRLTRARVGEPVEQVLGLPMSRLLDRVRPPGQPQRLCIANGLHLWVRAHLPGGPAARLQREKGRSRLDAPVSAASSSPSPAEALSTVLRQWTLLDRDPSGPPSPEDLTLHGGRRARVEEALEATGGNVARAARMLGVSRGLIYRHQRSQDGRGGQSRPGTASSAGQPDGQQREPG